MTGRLVSRLRDRQLIAGIAALAALFALTLVLHRAASAAPPPPPPSLLAVADLRGHALVVLNTSTGAVRRIALPGGPHELLRLPDGRLAVSLEQSGLLAVVDPATGRVEARDLGGLPHGIALQGDTLYVTDRSRDELRRLRVIGATVADWQELAPLRSGAWPHIVAALPGGELAVAAAGDSTLRVGTHVIHVSELPETVAVAPGGGAIATAGALGGTLQVFDATGRPLWSREVGGRPVRVLFGPDGTTVVASLSASHAIALVDAAQNVRLVAVGGAPDGLAYDASGRLLYVGDLATGRVSVVDVAAGRVLATFDIGESAGSLLLLDGAPLPPAT